ncbi:MAG: HAMP domain-containing protein [Candidatus Riflebacteria bacterium]|nr:HAMP domain-containing protein [Candidatus Riflebacteria bacterium]
MSDRRGLIMLVAIALILSAIVGYHLSARLDNALDSSRRIDCLEEMRHLLPLLRQRMKPLELGRERLLASAYSCVPHNAPMNKTAALRLARRFECEFPGRIRYGIWNASGTLLAANRLATGTLRAVNLYMHIITMQEEKQRPYSEGIKIEQQRRWIFPKLFGASTMWVHKENRLSITEGTFRGVSGLIFRGYLFPREQPDISSQELIKRPGLLRGADDTTSRGWVFAFVPVSVLEDRAWRLYAAGQPIPNLPFRLECTTLEALERHRIFTRETADACRRLFENGATGIASETHDGRVFGLFRPDQSSRNIILAVPESHDNPRFSRSPAAFAVAAGALIALFLGSRLYLLRYSTWAPALLRKFTLLALLACITPTGGLFWIMTERHSWDAETGRTREYQLLDNRLFSPELRNNLVEGAIVSRVKVLLERHDWVHSIPSDKLLEKLLAPLRDVELQWMVIHSRRGADLMLQNTPWGIISCKSEGNSDKGVQILQTLMEFMKRGLKFEDDSSSKNAAHVQTTSKTDLILESAIPYMGRENTYGMILQNDSLVTYKFADGVTWIYRHCMNDQQGKPAVLFFMIFDRFRLQRKMAAELAEIPLVSRHETPPFVFVRPSQRDSFVMTPERALWQPLIGTTLSSILSDGGIVKLPMKLDGRIRLTFSRALRGTDYAGTAIGPDPRSHVEKRLPWLSIITILYPLGVIGLTVLLFRMFYLGPLRAAKVGIDCMAEGNYTIQLPIVSDDEIGRLSSSFNRMADGLREKEYLSRFLSDLAMEATRRSETPPATRLRATVLFSDIRGFTTLSERYPGEEIVEMLNHYFTRMEEVIESEGGTIDKFIGDAIMAVFLPVHGRANPAIRSIRAGLAMREELSVFMHERAANGKFTFNIGVGIATGEVLMGVLGESAKRHDFTVIGPTVNRAAFMEKQSKKAHTTFVVACPETVAELNSDWVYVPIASESRVDDAFEIIEEG